MPLVRKIIVVDLAQIKHELAAFITNDESKHPLYTSFNHNRSFNQHQMAIAKHLFNAILQCKSQKEIKVTIEESVNLLKENMLEIYDHLDGKIPRPAFDDGGPVMLCTGHIIGYGTREQLQQALDNGSAGTPLYRKLCSYLRADRIDLDIVPNTAYHFIPDYITN